MSGTGSGGGATGARRGSFSLPWAVRCRLLGTILLLCSLLVTMIPTTQLATTITDACVLRRSSQQYVALATAAKAKAKAAPSPIELWARLRFTQGNGC